MSLQQGTLSITRYRTLGARKNYSLEEVGRKLKGFQAKPLKTQGVLRELVFGWVRPAGIDPDEEVLQDDMHWDISDCQIDSGYLLRFRVERRKVPMQLFQMMVQQELAKHTAKQLGKPLERAEKKQIMDDLKEELLGNCLPAIRHCDLLWREKHGDILVFATGKSDLKIFEDLFRETFAKPLGFSFILELPAILGMSDQELEEKKSDTPSRQKLLEPVVPAEFLST